MLALIAGGGALPRHIAHAQPDSPLICAYEGTAPEGLTPDLTFRLETLGSLVKALVARGVTQVCFCGAVARPVFDPAALDADTVPLVPLFEKALTAGDDGALRVVIGVFRDSGLDVVGIDQVAPDLLAKRGVLGAVQPDARMHQDAERGAAVLAALAPLDVGQACVVGQGQVMGIETIGGTDHLLRTLPERAAGASALLVKGAKPGQSRDADLPTVGPDTLRAAQAAGLGGVVVAAGDVIILDPETCVALADTLGIVLWARSGAPA